VAADVVLSALLGAWNCTWSNYPGAGYKFVFTADRRGLFENPNVPANLRKKERFAYRLEHVERNRYGFIGELYQAKTTRYLFTIYGGKLKLSEAEQFSTNDRAFYPVPDGDEYNCVRAKRPSP